MQEYESVNYKGYEIKIYHDEDPMDPREWDNLGTMMCAHREYNLGDEFVSGDEIREFIEENTDIILLPLYLYDHGGITMSTGRFSCPWDSGQVGIIYITKEKARKEYDWKYLTKERIQKIVRYLENEVETYDDYLTGNVFGYQIWKDGEEEDGSCWGFFGHDHEESNLLGYAQDEIDHLIEKEQERIKAGRKRHADYLKGIIRKRIPFIYRKPLIV